MLANAHEGDFMSEKTEKATAYKLKKGREQGRVSKSIELNTSVFLLLMLGVSGVLWPSVMSHMELWFERFILLSNRFTLSFEHVVYLQRQLLTSLLSLWLPFALAGSIIIVMTSLSQTGFIFSLTPLVPDAKRLNLLDGFKRLFSSKILFDTGKTTLKLSLSCLLLTLSIQHELFNCLNTVKHPPAESLLLFIPLLSKILLQLIALLLAIALLDKLYTRWKFAKDNRMSKQEIKDEYRQREGDPKIKFKIKQLQQLQRLKSASFINIKTADVVITNPTHLAVVLKYERGLMPAPKVIYKVRGEAVQHVKKMAARYNIPVIENKALARTLYASSEINQWVKREHFPMVASLFRDLYRMKASTS